MAILLKCARQTASAEDGARVLIERRRPRGVSKESLALRAWLKALAPGADLQRWFKQYPRQWPLFRRRYLDELRDEQAMKALEELHSIAAHEKRVTLLTAADEPEHSHAAILRDLIEGAKKPPSTSGPARAASAGRIRAARRQR
jgi:uncharacterized protein YeaO (DUF488 family)